MPAKKQGLYQREPGGVWYVDIHHAGHRVRRSTGQSDYKKAEAVRNDILLKLLQHVPVLNEHSWGEAVLEWAKARPRSASDLLSLKKFARYFPDCGLSTITRDTVHEALSFCRTDGTYTRYRTLIAAILNLAVDNGWLKEAPKLKQRESKVAKTRDWLTHEQWDKLYLELPEHQRAPAAFSIEVGLRKANTLGLQWKQVDLKRRVAWVEAEDTKAGRALAVPLSNKAVEILQALVGKHKTYVFVHRGKPLGDTKTAFKAACIRAGLGRIAKRPNGELYYDGFTWHGFRHTWATWHVQNGTPLDVLQKLGGWADLRMVMRYAHHSPGHLASFANTKRTSHD
jgi:integrase